MRLHFITGALLFASLSTASWQDSLNLKAMDIAGFIRRADSSSTSYAESTLGNTAASSANPTDDTSSTATSDSSASTTTDGSASSSGSSASSSGSSGATSTSGGSSTTTTSGSTSSDKSTSGTTSTSSSNSTSTDTATGGVTMISPNTASSTSYYKIGNYVTFVWNYTSLSVTPTAIDILASCSANEGTYTLALNQSVSASTGAVTWDTGAYQSTATLPLLTETYTLIIHDAALAISATATGGELGTFDTFTFGMYTPQPYTPLADYICATCSGAMGSMERQTLGFLLAMVGITVASFTIFAGGAGVF